MFLPSFSHLCPFLHVSWCIHVSTVPSLVVCPAPSRVVHPPPSTHPLPHSTLLQTSDTNARTNANPHVHSPQALDSARFRAALQICPTFFRAGGWMPLGGECLLSVLHSVSFFGSQFWRFTAPSLFEPVFFSASFLVNSRFCCVIRWSRILVARVHGRWALHVASFPTFSRLPFVLLCFFASLLPGFSASLLLYEKEDRVPVPADPRSPPLLIRFLALSSHLSIYSLTFSPFHPLTFPPFHPHIALDAVTYADVTQPSPLQRRTSSSSRRSRSSRTTRCACTSRRGTRSGCVPSVSYILSLGALLTRLCGHGRCTSWCGT